MPMSQATRALSPCREPQLPGTWKLVAGRAITLEPREAGLLKVAHGRVWMTFEGPHAGRANESGDHVLGAGEELRIRRGQRLVIEAWNEGCPAYFSWDPAPAPAVARRSAGELVVQPLADLRLALVFGGHALARLASGLVQAGWQSLTGGGRAAAQERACTRHGAMT